MKVTVDSDACTGCGLCVDSCPNVFSLEGDVAEANAGSIAADDEECAKKAAEDCPVEAIKVA